MMKRSIPLAMLLAAVFALSASLTGCVYEDAYIYEEELAEEPIEEPEPVDPVEPAPECEVDESKITGCWGSVSQGGSVIGGKPGAVPPGATVSGGGRTATADDDGSFFLPIGFDHAEGDEIQVTIEHEGCEETITVTLERC